MNIDKIKLAINPAIYEYWKNQHDIDKINSSRYQLKKELECRDINQYMDMDMKNSLVAEYALLCIKADKGNDLDFSLIFRERKN